jgi:hypothetical protein
MAIIRSARSVLHTEPDPGRLAAALLRLCEREGLEPCEIVGIIATALTWPPHRPLDAMPLLRRFALAA